MQDILAGAATPAQIAGFAVALRMRGETVDEIAGLARAMRQALPPFPEVPRPLLDTCGTGGDGSGTFNVSTAVAFVVAAAGVRVAKHGNRAVSSRAGSADVLEALGASRRPDAGRGRARARRRRRHVPVRARSTTRRSSTPPGPRRELGVRTVFNVLGPLSNPAGAARQLVGVYDRTLGAAPGRGAPARSAPSARGSCTRRTGSTSCRSSRPRASPRLEDGRDRRGRDRPAPVGLGARRPSAPAGPGRRRGGERAHRSRPCSRPSPGAAHDIVVLNAAAALVVAGVAPTLEDGVERAASLDRPGRRRSRSSSSSWRPSAPAAEAVSHARHDPGRDRRAAGGPPSQSASKRAPAGLPARPEAFGAAAVGARFRGALPRARTPAALLRFLCELKKASPSKGVLRAGLRRRGARARLRARRRRRALGAHRAGLLPGRARRT